MIVLYAAFVAAGMATRTVAPDSSCYSATRDTTFTVDLRGIEQRPDTEPRRRRAVEYSDWYARRLAIHRIGSYTMLPLFGAEWILGNQLMHDNPSSAIKPAHVAVATGIAALFTVNTVTGGWNWWESRSDPSGRTRRTIHALTMLAADAGFVWTGVVAEDAKRSDANARRHRNVALGSIGVATIGTAMMWLWKD
jgi:hypothetical protein